jgi:eukaryotic-like serine/threonine-protein kinase
MSESFGSMLRQYRVARGLTQEALAEQAMLSPTAIAALERGRNRAPRMSTLRQLARALDLSREELAALSLLVSNVRTSTDAEPGGDLLTASVLPEASLPGATPLAGQDISLESPIIPLSPAAARRWRTGFVGRGHEFEQLQDSWSRRCRITQVVGESGIGKTRLVAELVRSLPDSTTVLWGRCSQDHLGSYLPFVEILRHVVTRADDATLRSAVGGRGELTRLVPELVRRVGPLPTPTRAEADSEQRMLFEAISALLAWWTPMVLVVDDLHWADDASLALLGYLVRDHTLTELVTVVTARPSDLSPMASGLLAELGRDVDFARVRLDGLDSADLARLVADLVGAPPPPALVDSVAAATEGNPFFAEELILHLVDTRLVVDADGEIVLAGNAQQAGVPERVRETVMKRLLSFTPDAIELLSVGAAIGREFELALAGSASELTGMRLVDASDEALMSGMVVETVPGRLAFSHALLRDAINSRLSFARRASLHRRVARAIEDSSEVGPSTAAELAHHWAIVAQVDPLATVAAATWAVRAGDEALASAAAEEAIARYEEASALWARTSTGHVDAVIRLGVALHYRGRAEDADARFREAIQLAIALGEPTLQARAAIGLGRRYPYWETDQARIGALEAALTGLPPDQPALRVVLMGLLVTHLITGFEPEQARRRDALADELSAIAADPKTSLELLLAIGQTRIYDCIEDPTILSEVAGRLLGVAQMRNDLRVEVGAWFAQALAALDRGEMPDLVYNSERYSDVSTRLGDPRERSQAMMVRSTIAFIEGRYDDAAGLSDEALKLGQVSGDFNAELIHYAQGVLRAVDQGLAREVLPLLLAATEYQQIVAFDAGTSLCAALAGEHGQAMAGVHRLVRSGYQGSPRGADRLAPTAFLAHVCDIVGDSSDADVLYEQLSGTRSKVVRVGPLAGWWGPLDHHLGCLADLLGRHEEAEQRLRNALRIEERMGARPFTARTLARLAGVLTITGPARAAAVAEESMAVAAQIGAPGIIGEVEAALAKAGATP